MTAWQDPPFLLRRPAQFELLWQVQSVLVACMQSQMGAESTAFRW